MAFVRRRCAARPRLPEGLVRGGGPLIPYGAHLSAERDRAEAERRHLRELHESVSQALYGIALNASAAEAVRERDPGRLVPRPPRPRLDAGAGDRSRRHARDRARAGRGQHATPDQAVSLSEFRGRPVILAFYPADWSPVCGDQLALYNEVQPEFQRFDAELLGISVDGVWCHLAYAKDRKLRFPLLSDFEPKGEVARQYGVYRARNGTTERALFVLDDGGVVRWSYVSPIGVNPGADGILRALEGLGSKEKVS